MNYLKAEHLKFKRTISNKLLFIAPFLTALFAWIVGGFYGFQHEHPVSTPPHQQFFHFPISYPFLIGDPAAPDPSR